MTDFVALVAGASRGVGRGVACELSNLGATVYATGRTIESADLPASVTRLTCDHTDDAAVEAVFKTIREEQGHLEVLVNSVWGGYERMVEDGEFTWPLPFWNQPRWRWSAMMNAGVRAAFVASQEAARIMVPTGRGLIVNLSYWSARKHLGNVIYGVSKAATDKLSSDMAHELKAHDVAAVSLYPGLVRTEAVVSSGVFDLSNSESPEFIGRVIASLWQAPNLMEFSGQALVAAELALSFGVADADGKAPRPLTIDEA